MKLLTTGLAVVALSVPVFAQGILDQPTPGTGYGPGDRNPVQAAANANIAKSNALLFGDTAVSTIAKQGVYGAKTDSDYGRGKGGKHGHGYGYGYPVPVPVPVPVYPGYGGYPYPAYGYPAPYPTYPGYGYGYQSPYPQNTIVGAPLTQPNYAFERPPYVTSIPLGQTYYSNNNYPSSYYPPYYGYGYKQSTGASVTFGTGNTRVKIGSSRTIIR